jgi:CheY-like chemotaxis protein
MVYDSLTQSLQDLIVLDVLMPGLDGREVLRRVQLGLRSLSATRWLACGDLSFDRSVRCEDA